MLWKYYRAQCGSPEDSPGLCCGQSFWQQAIRLNLAFICSILFFVYLAMTYMNYAEERVGSNISWPELEVIPFPSVSICERFYDIGQMDEDLDIGSLVEVDSDNCTDDPTKLYKVAAAKNISVSKLLWKYHFTLDKIFAPRNFSAARARPSCSIASYSCDVPPDVAVLPDASQDWDYATASVDVPAGTWTSQFMADSDVGANILCHTLKTNVTVNFSQATGNLIDIRWSREFRTSLDYWRVYVHDPDEHVMLVSFGKLPPANVVVLRSGEHDFMPATNVSKCRQSVLISPKMMIRVADSAVHPCNNSQGYSPNLCEETFGWERRLDKLKATYGDRFGCVLPGILVANDSYKMPVCQHLRDSDSASGQLGLLNLLSLQDNPPKGFASNEERPVLSRPPVCANLLHSSCDSRCDAFEYGLSVERLCQEKGSSVDMELYFATPTVETQRDFLVMSGLDFVSNVGGGMGLLLGVSFLEISYLIFDFAVRIFQAAHGVKRARDDFSKAEVNHTLFVKTSQADASDLGLIRFSAGSWKF